MTKEFMVSLDQEGKRLENMNSVGNAELRNA